MRLYRILRSIHRGYPLTVFWLYVGLFALAFPLIFVFPQLTLGLFGLGLAGLVGVILVAKLLDGLLHLTARRKLNAGACPDCGARREEVRDAGAAWQCEHCGTVFLPNGAEAAGG